MAVENTVLGGMWSEDGWNGISGCRFVPNPHLSLDELADLDPGSERGLRFTLRLRPAPARTITMDLINMTNQ